MGMIETIQSRKPTDSAPAAPKQPRAVGEARVGAGPESRLKDLRQQGCCKALLPMTAGPGLDAVLVNTAGGITGGDRIAWGGAAAQGARLTLTTQACERGYRALPGESGEVRAELSVADGGRIDWLPQETILFDHCALSRRFEAALEGDAALLACESVLFGRAAMGERLEAVEFADAWRVRRDGKLVFADTLRLSGPDALGRAFCMDGAGACATILFTAPGAADMERGAREALGDAPGAGLSLVAEDILVARLLAPSGFALRRRMIPLLAALRGAPLPKVWTL